MPKRKGDKNGEVGNRIDKAQFEALAGIFCTSEEVRAVFHVSQDTLRRWCKATYGMTIEEALHEYQGAGKAALRRYQFRQAEKNPTMAIFLGKNYLGQGEGPEKAEDKVEISHDVPTEGGEG